MNDYDDDEIQEWTLKDELERWKAKARELERKAREAEEQRAALEKAETAARRNAALWEASPALRKETAAVIMRLKGGLENERAAIGGPPAPPTGARPLADKRAAMRAGQSGIFSAFFGAGISAAYDLSKYASKDTDQDVQTASVPVDRLAKLRDNFYGLRFLLCAYPANAAAQKALDEMERLENVLRPLLKAPEGEEDNAAALEALVEEKKACFKAEIFAPLYQALDAWRKTLSGGAGGMHTDA